MTYTLPIHPMLVWLAALLLGIALGIAIAAWIPGWSKPYRLDDNFVVKGRLAGWEWSTDNPTPDEMLALDSALEQDETLGSLLEQEERDYYTEYSDTAENSLLYQRALGGDREALDKLGARAGRVVVAGFPPWGRKMARDAAWLLYDLAAPRHIEVRHSER